MIEIELFYKIVEAHIRTEQSEYLESLKRVPLIEDGKKRHIPFKKLPVNDKLLKGFNKGIKTAVKILTKEFNQFDKRLKQEEKGGSKF